MEESKALLILQRTGGVMPVSVPVWPKTVKHLAERLSLMAADLAAKAG